MHGMAGNAGSRVNEGGRVGGRRGVGGRGDLEALGPEFGEALAEGQEGVHAGLSLALIVRRQHWLQDLIRLLLHMPNGKDASP